MKLKTSNYDRNKVFHAIVIDAQIKDGKHAESFASRLL